MSDPWAEFQAVSPAKQERDPWAEFQPAQPKQAPYSGTILPFSRNEEGRVSFDPSAGIFGIIGRAAQSAWSGATLPRDVYQGKVDPRSEEAAGRALELATLATPVNPAVASGSRAIPGAANAMVRQEVAPPTAEALRLAAAEGYDAVRDAGVVYSADAVRSVAQAARAGLEQDGILAELAPKTFSILQRLESPPAGSVAPISGIEAARRSFGHAKKDFANPTEQMAAGRVTDALDRFVATPDPASVVAGPATTAGRTLSEARANSAAAFRSDRLTGIEEAAELRAAAANSGANGDNAVRSRVANLLLDPKKSAGFNEAELAQLDLTARGTPARNALRYAGNVLGGGGGMGSVVSGSVGAGLGAILGGPTGAAVAGASVPAAGAAAKRVATALTERSLAEADAMTRMRSPLYEQLLADAPMVALDPTKRALYSRLLMQPSFSAPSAR